MQKLSKHSELAKDLFTQGYNCAQSVVGAFSDEMGLDFDLCLKLSSSFGGGMGRLREVCGTVSGMFMVAGVLYGYTNPNDKSGKIEHYNLIQSLAADFQKQNGTIICRELLGLPSGKDSPVPEERSKEYYKRRPCVELVGQAAEIMDRLIESKK